MTLLVALQQLPVHPNVIGFRIGLAAKFRDGGAIDLHVAGRNEFFGLAPRGNSSSRDDLLQAFERHLRTVEDQPFQGRVREILVTSAWALI